MARAPDSSEVTGCDRKRSAYCGRGTRNDSADRNSSCGLSSGRWCDSTSWTSNVSRTLDDLQAAVDGLADAGPRRSRRSPSSSAPTSLRFERRPVAVERSAARRQRRRDAATSETSGAGRRIVNRREGAGDALDDWYGRDPRRSAPEVDFGMSWRTTSEPNERWRVSWNSGSRELFAARLDRTEVQVLGTYPDVDGRLVRTRRVGASCARGRWTRLGSIRDARSRSGQPTSTDRSRCSIRPTATGSGIGSPTRPLIGRPTGASRSSSHEQRRSSERSTSELRRRFVVSTEDDDVAEAILASDPPGPDR